MDSSTDLNENWMPASNLKSQVKSFYDNAKVFVTGGTGFLGKLLIEKLLRSTNVSTIYMLIREKKGKDTHERMDSFFDDIVFDNLKREAPKIKHKIVPVQGDCTLAGLGLNINDRQMLLENVNVVFHVAATVNFDEKLKLAYSINVKGTESVLEICKQSENLKAFVHVSTVYSNCHLDKIDEAFYDIVSYKDVELLLEKMDDDDVEMHIKRILGNWPNTYTFTKALAESVIQNQGNGVPVGVFRPAIVTSTYKEPLEGWIDNLYGPTGVCAGAASGVLRTMQCRDETIANIVPGDMCISALIVAAWDISNINRQRKASSLVPIYNYVSCVENPISWGEYNMVNQMYGEVYPVLSAIWCIKFKCTRSRMLYNLRKILYHYLPAISLDVLGILVGRKPRLCKLYNKVHKFSDVITYFCTRDWTFSNNNVVNLWKKMNDEDRRLFPFNIENLNWLKYFKTYILGIRLYLLKDPVNTIPEAKIRHDRLKMLHSILKFSIGFVTLNICWSIFSQSLNSIITNKAIW